MNETESIVSKFAKELGCEVYHNGAPDFLLVRRPQDMRSTIEIALVEVKSPNDKLHVAQENWLNCLRDAGIPAAVIRVSPSDSNENIRKTLDDLLTPSTEGAWAEYIKEIKMREFSRAKMQVFRPLEEARAEITFLKRHIAILNSKLKQSPYMRMRQSQIHPKVETMEEHVFT